MEFHLKDFLENTIPNDFDGSWESFLVLNDGHFTRNSFIKQNKVLIQLILEDIMEENSDFDSSFCSVSTLYMAVD